MIYDCLPIEEKMNKLKADGGKRNALLVITFLIGIFIGGDLVVAFRAIQRVTPAKHRVKCIACHNIKTHPPEQLLTYKSYRAFHSKLVKEL